MSKKPTPAWVALAFLSLSSRPAQAMTIPSLDTTTASAFVKTVGLCMDNRSYQPATTQGGNVALDIGIETSLVQPPSDLGTAFGSLSGSSSSSSSSIPIIPSLKLSLHKGFGERFEIGGSVLPTLSSFQYIGGSLLLGFDAKFVIYQPEEGLTWAIRGSYNYNNLTVNYSGMTIAIKSATITPQLLVSRKLDFADPYIGLGLQYTWGSISATVPVPVPEGLPVAIPPYTLESNGSGYNAFLFIGVAMRIPTVGFKITLEGAYSPFGMNYIGTKISFSF